MVSMTVFVRNGSEQGSVEILRKHLDDDARSGDRGIDAKSLLTVGNSKVLTGYGDNQAAYDISKDGGQALLK